MLKAGMKMGMPLSSSSFSLQAIFVLKIIVLLQGVQRTPEQKKKKPQHHTHTKKNNQPTVAVGQVREILVLSGQKQH